MTSLFITILNMSITASYVALAVIFIRLILKKAPKIFSYSLWAVLLFRLICPVSFASGLSLIPSKPDTIPQDIVYSQNPAVNSGIGLIDNAVNQSMNSSLPAVNTAASVNPMGMVMDFAAFFWLLGLIILLSYGALSYFRLKCRLSTATLVKENILETDRISTPFVLGFFRPKIYIPTEIDENELAYVIRHEQTHIRRRDYLIKPIAFLALSLHWFNPLMWISYFLMAKDMEMSCDESVLQQFDRDIRADYSHSLLSLSIKKSALLVPLAFGESHVKSRIKNILHYKKPVIWVIVMAMVLVATAAIGLTTNPQSDDFDLESVKTRAMLFSTEESDLLKIGEAAYDHYYSSFMGENIPEEYRITEFKLTNISLAAGDEKEFCVRITSDYSTTGPYFLSANGSFIPNNPNDAENGGTCEGDQSEFRIKSLGNNEYQIVSVGTGGGAQGLMPADPAERKQFVEDKINIIMSSPKSSSNPGDYIKAHQDEYNAILSLDVQALPYLFSEFEKGGQTGLKGYIMERLCRKILFEEDIKYEATAPQDWYDTYKTHMQKLVELNSLEFVQKNYPKAALLLTVSEQADKIIILPDFTYDGTDPIEKLVYATEIEKNSNPARGFTVVAPKIFASYKEGDLLKVFVTTYSARYQLYGNTLSLESGSVIPAAITYKNDGAGNYVLSDYEQAKDGSHFGPSIRAFCTMPVSGDEITGLADKIIDHYGNKEDIRTLQHENLRKHLKANKQTDVTPFYVRNGKIS